MGLIADLFGGTQSDAANNAARFQVNALNKGIDTQNRNIARADNLLAPIAQEGLRGFSDTAKLATDPAAQRDFIQNSPFYGALADDAQRRVFNNAAARGKVGSGGTAEALQKSMLLLGDDLLNSDINRRMALHGMGIGATNNQVNVGTAGANNITDLLSEIGNSKAAGEIGAANAEVGGTQNIIDALFSAGKLALDGSGNLLGESGNILKSGVNSIGDLVSGVSELFSAGGGSFAGLDIGAATAPDLLTQSLFSGSNSLSGTGGFLFDGAGASAGGEAAGGLGTISDLSSFFSSPAGGALLGLGATALPAALAFSSKSSARDKRQAMWDGIGNQIRASGDGVVNIGGKTYAMDPSGKQPYGAGSFLMKNGDVLIVGNSPSDARIESREQASATFNSKNDPLLRTAKGILGGAYNVKNKGHKRVLEALRNPTPSNINKVPLRWRGAVMSEVDRNNFGGE